MAVFPQGSGLGPLGWHSVIQKDANGSPGGCCHPGGRIGSGRRFCPAQSGSLHVVMPTWRWYRTSSVFLRVKGRRALRQRITPGTPRWERSVYGLAHEL